MGTAPGTSARCAQCRQKKRRCGLEKPVCLRCVRAGIQCSGPLETTIYVNLDTKSMHHPSHRKALHDAYAGRSYQTTRFQVLTRQEYRYQELLIESSHSPLLTPVSQLPSPFSGRTLYEAITDEFTPRLKVSVFSGDRLQRREPIYSSVATSIKALLPHVSRHNQVSDLGLFSLLTRYIGALKEDENLSKLAMSSYTEALGQFHQNLSRMEHLLHSHPHSIYASWVLLCLCLSLLLFELIDQPSTFTSTYETHLDGALTVLQTTGPAIYRQSNNLQLSFAGLRGLVIPTILRRRQKTFLAEEQWLNLPFSMVGKSRVARLHDLALLLPGLIEQTDNMKSANCQSHIESNDYSSLIHLANQYLELRQRLFEWLRQLIIVEQEPIYWPTNESPYVAAEDLMCIPHFSHGTHKISFRDGPRAGILSHYWSYHLELIMGLLDLWEILPNDDSMFLNLAPDLDLASCHREAESLAEMIMETIPYLSSCLEGRITMQGPLEIVNRYYQRVVLVSQQ